MVSLHRIRFGRRSSLLLLLTFLLIPYIIFYCVVDQDPLYISRWLQFLFYPKAKPAQNCSHIMPKIFHLRRIALEHDYLMMNNMNNNMSKNPSSSSFSSSSSSSSPSSSSSSSTLYLTPAIIHQTWKNHRLPPRFREWSHSWQKCFPHWNYNLWSDYENRCLIQEIYPWFLPTYDSYPYNIHRVDAVRYFYMHYFGGLYTDLDNECLRSFPNLLASKKVVLGAMNGSRYFVTVSREGYIQNSFMYSTPNHKLWEKVFYYLMKRKLGTVEVVTGPIILMMAINDYRDQHQQLFNNNNNNNNAAEENNHNNYSNEEETDLMIYPGYYFNPFSWLNNPYPTECKALNNMNDGQLKNCRAHFTNSSYVIQYHVQSWNRGEKNVYLPL